MSLMDLTKKKIRVFVLTDEIKQKDFLKQISHGEFYIDENLCFNRIEQSLFEDILVILTKILCENSWQKLQSNSKISTIFISNEFQQEFVDQEKIFFYSNHDHLVKVLHEKIDIIQNQSFIYSLFNNRKNDEYLSKQSSKFIWFRLLIDVLRQLPENIQIENEIFEKYFHQYEEIETLKKTYSSEQIMSLYTNNNSYLINILNYAFQTENFQLIYFFRVLILDFYTISITNEKSIIYYYQLLTRKEIQELKQHLGSWILINNFLLKSTEKKFEKNFYFHEYVQWEIPCLMNFNSIYQIETIDYDIKENYWSIKLSSKENFDENIHIENLMIDFGRILWKNLENFQQGEFYFEILLKTNQLNREDIYFELAHLKCHLKDYQSALNNYQLALEFYEKQDAKMNNIQMSSLFNSLGFVCKHLEKFDQAIDYFQQGLKFIEKNSSQQIELLLHLSAIYQEKKDYENALNSLLSAYEIEEKLFSINDLNLLKHFEDILYLFKKLDQYDQAIEYSRRRISQFQIDNHNQLQMARIYTLLGTIHEDRNPKQADQYYQQSISLLQTHPSEPIFLQSLSTMISFYWKCRMFDRAVLCQMKLLDYRQKHLLHNQLDLAYTLRDLGRLYRVMNKLTEALDYFEQSSNILRKHFGNEHIQVKNIEKEIFDLKEILLSLSSTPNDDYQHRRISNAHKSFQFSQTDLKSTDKIILHENSELKKKSVICNIL